MKSYQSDGMMHFDSFCLVIRNISLGKQIITLIVVIGIGYNSYVDENYM